MDQERLATLEARLQLLEDEREITRLVASYGPLVDSASADQVAELWTTDGVYDVEDLVMQDQEAIRTMVNSPEHHGLLAMGCAHFLGPVHVTVDGNHARAVCHSILMLNLGQDGQLRFTPVRVGANLFQLTRQTDGWRIAHRTTRTLSGSDEARALLSHGVLGNQS